MGIIVMPLLYILIFVPLLIPLTALWAMAPAVGSAWRSWLFWAGLGVMSMGLVLAGLVNAIVPGEHWGILEASRGLVFVMLFSPASVYTVVLVLLCVIAVWARSNSRTVKDSKSIKNYLLAAQLLGFVVCVGVAASLYLLITSPPPISS